jgi:uncharacterized protein YkwD
MLSLLAATLTGTAATVTEAAAGADAGTAAVSEPQQSAPARALLIDINALRRQHDKPDLVFSSELGQAAKAHALSMARRGYFSHRNADGTPFWQRLRRYYPVGGANTWSVGENLFWSALPATPTAIASAWLASPEHAQILLGEWKEIGLAILRAQHAPGFFAGRDVLIAVADFGRRSP